MPSDQINDIEALAGKPRRSRREFLRNTTAATACLGFASVAEPTFAQVIQTNFDGIEAGEETIKDGDTELYAYVARPKNTAGKLPVVVIASEILVCTNISQTLRDALQNRGIWP